MIELSAIMAGASLLAYALGQRQSSRRLLAAGTWAMVLTCLALLLLLILRGILGQHWPLGSRYDFTLAFAWIISAIYVATERITGDRSGGAGVAGITLVILVGCTTASSDVRAIGPLPESLRSSWLQAHVLTMLIGYGCVAVAAGLEMMTLGALSDRANLGDTAVRLTRLALAFLSIGIILGSLWAHRAWGRYWAWDPKETGSFIAWMYYMGVLYAQKRVSPRTRAWLLQAGLALVLFNLAGVPVLAKSLNLRSLHGY